MHLLPVILGFLMVMVGIATFFRSNSSGRDYGLGIVMLGIAIGIRSPGLGDTYIDSFFDALTERSNVSEIAAHVLTLIAIATAIGSTTGSKRTSQALAGFFSLVLFLIWISTDLSRVPTSDLTRVDNAAPYFMIFSFGLGYTLVRLSVFSWSVLKHEKRTSTFMLLGGSVSGVIYCAVKILMVSFYIASQVPGWALAFSWTCVACSLIMLSLAAVFRHREKTFAERKGRLSDSRSRG